MVFSGQSIRNRRLPHANAGSDLVVRFVASREVFAEFAHCCDRIGSVFVLVLKRLRILFFQLRPLRLEGIGNIFQEDEAQRDMLVFRWLQIATQLIGGLKQVRFEADISSLAVFKWSSPTSHRFSPARLSPGL